MANYGETASERKNPTIEERVNAFADQLGVLCGLIFLALPKRTSGKPEVVSPLLAVSEELLSWEPLLVASPNDAGPDALASGPISST